MFIKRTANRRTARRAAGFSFVEALATLVLVAIVLPVLMRGITMAMVTGANAARRTQATVLVESKLHELLAIGDFAESQMEGDFAETPSGEIYIEADPDGPNYRWEAETTEWIDAALLELRVSVFWTTRGQEYDVTLYTLVPAEQ